VSVSNGNDTLRLILEEEIAAHLLHSGPLPQDPRYAARVIVGEVMRRLSDAGWRLEHD
jgi:hypothetical protein